MEIIVILDLNVLNSLNSQDLWRIRAPCGTCEGFDVSPMDEMIQVQALLLQTYIYSWFLGANRNEPSHFSFKI